MRFMHGVFLIIISALTIALSNQVTLANATKHANPNVTVWYHGVWEGNTVQTDPNSRYTTIQSIGEGEIGTVVGTIAYPELRCGGIVHLASKILTKIKLHESIRYRSSCVDDGIMELTSVNSNASQFRWYSNTHPAIANSTLTQISVDSNLLPQQYIGVWEGKGTQNSGSSWSILITLTEGETNNIVGTIAYPSLNCGGNLTLLNVDSSELTFREAITYGSNCIDQGTVTLSVNELSNNMSYVWDKGSSNATGSLQKLSIGQAWPDLSPLQQDYQNKIGTRDEWYSKFWLCLNQNACDEYLVSGETGNVGGFNKYMFDYFNAHPERSALDYKCNYPGFGATSFDLIKYECFLRSGSLHFKNELIPGFFSYGKLVDVSEHDEWDSSHIDFVQAHNLPCFDNVFENAFEDNPTYRAAIISQLKKQTLASANQLRETVQFYHSIRQALSRNSGKGDESIVSRFSQDYPDPLDKSALYSEELEIALPIKVATANSDFFVQVGSSYQLVDTRSLVNETTQDGSEISYSLLSDNSVATLTENGLLTIHATSSPFANARPMVFVLVRIGDDFGVGQFAIQDSDRDNDLLADSFEDIFGLDSNIANNVESDLDSDELGDHSELIMGSNPLVPDTDGDGFTDNEEYLADSDLLDAHCTPEGCTYSVFIPIVIK